MKCPNCGATITATPGVETICPNCGHKLYIPPPRIYTSPYEGCTSSVREAAELLEKAKKKPLTPEEIALVEFYKATGLVQC